VSDRQKTSSKKQTRRPNRAQRRAQEVRLAESSVPAPIDMTVALDQEELARTADTAPAVAKSRANRRQAQAVTYVLPRDVEYGYIRSDLRRLIITASALLIVMFVLLFLLD
jgi:hypothetical protein